MAASRESSVVRKSRRKRNGALTARVEAFIFNTDSTIELTSRYHGRRYVVLVTDRECYLPQKEMELLIEYVVARLTSSTGYLSHDKCCTVRNNPGYIGTLADRLRKNLGGDSFLLGGNRCYFLPFEKDHIRVCRGILEMTELNEEVISKLAAVIDK